jgi:hypothetical protein
VPQTLRLPDFVKVLGPRNLNTAAPNRRDDRAAFATEVWISPVK